MIKTPYGLGVKWVVKLDENRQLATVIGFQKQVATYAVSALIVDGGLAEIHKNHAEYIAHRDALENIESTEPRTLDHRTTTEAQ